MPPHFEKTKECVYGGGESKMEVTLTAIPDDSKLLTSLPLWTYANPLSSQLVACQYLFKYAKLISPRIVTYSYRWESIQLALTYRFNNSLSSEKHKRNHCEVFYNFQGLQSIARNKVMSRKCDATLYESKNVLLRIYDSFEFILCLGDISKKINF